MLEYALVLLVGFIVGTINGMAGGASLLSFPVLLAIGLNPVSATVTNSLGVSSANIFAWISNKQTGWEVFHKYKKIIFLATCFSALGAIALLALPSEVFQHAVPFLLLFATFSLLLPRKPRVGKLHKNLERSALAASGFYCGYFGPGQGVIVIATLSQDSSRTPQEVNSAKNVIVGITSALSNFMYLFSGHVVWPIFATLFVGSSLGGLVGGYWASRIPTQIFRALVFCVGLIASCWLFVRTF